MEKYLRPELSNKILTWINHNLVNYLKTNREDHNEIDHIIDYLESDKSPRRIDRMSYSEAVKNAAAWTKSLQKRGNDIIESASDTETVIKLDGGFRLALLKGKNAFKREGYLMSHCVASYHTKNTKVYSLRDKNNLPHCTIEVVTSGTMNQIKGKGNGLIHPKYIQLVIKSLKILGTEVNSRELENLGYYELDKEFLALIETKLSGVKTFKFNNSRYFYKYSQLLE